MRLSNAELGAARLAEADSPTSISNDSHGAFSRSAAVALWWFLLHDFVTTPITVLLSVAGAALVYGGLYLSLAGARYVFESVLYAGAWVLGLLMLAGAAATLAPAAPGELLTATASGWQVLASRARHLEQAIEDGDLELDVKIARRGVGDPAPRDGFGTPLLHLVKDPEMLGALLDAGLDPNAQDAEGRRLLMKTADTEIRQRLLDAGATPEAGRDRDFRLGRIIAAGSALICAATATSLAWSMNEPYVRFDEATCRVLDRRIFATEVGNREVGRTGKRPVVMQPYAVAVVEIDPGDEVRIAAGMSTSMATQSVQELRRLPIGSETRCWIDPRDPGRFTLLRGIPLAGGVGLAMLLVVTVVFGLIAILLGRGFERPS